MSSIVSVRNHQVEVSLFLYNFLFCTYRLFIYQDEDENEPEDEFFRSFRMKTVTNEPGPQYYDTLKDRFVRHAQVPERTKALVFVFVFVFVLAHEQAISTAQLSTVIVERFLSCLSFVCKHYMRNRCQLWGRLCIRASTKK